MVVACLEATVVYFEAMFHNLLTGARKGTKHRLGGGIPNMAEESQPVRWSTLVTARRQLTAASINVPYVLSMSIICKRTGASVKLAAIVFLDCW